MTMTAAFPPPSGQHSWKHLSCLQIAHTSIASQSALLKNTKRIGLCSSGLCSSDHIKTSFAGWKQADPIAQGSSILCSSWHFMWHSGPCIAGCPDSIDWERVRAAPAEEVISPSSKCISVSVPEICRQQEAVLQVLVPARRNTLSYRLSPGSVDKNCFGHPILVSNLVSPATLLTV